MLICSLFCLFSYWFSFLPCLIFSILSRVLLAITSQRDYLYPSPRLRPCMHKLLSMMWWFCVLFEKQVSAGIKVKELYPHSLQLNRSLEISHPFLSISIWWSLTNAKSFSMGCRVCPDEQNIVLVSKTLDLRMRHERWKKEPYHWRRFRPQKSDVQFQERDYFQLTSISSLLRHSHSSNFLTQTCDWGHLSFYKLSTDSPTGQPKHGTCDTALQATDSIPEGKASHCRVPKWPLQVSCVTLHGQAKQGNQPVRLPWSCQACSGPLLLTFSAWKALPSNTCMVHSFSSLCSRPFLITPYKITATPTSPHSIHSLLSSS